MSTLKSRFVSWLWDRTGATRLMDYHEEAYLRCKVELETLRFENFKKDFEAFKHTGLEAAPEEDAAAERLHWAESDLEDARVELEIFLGR